jgi:hypothetical protein
VSKEEHDQVNRLDDALLSEELEEAKMLLNTRVQEFARSEQQSQNNGDLDSDAKFCF